MYHDLVDTLGGAVDPTLKSETAKIQCRITTTVAEGIILNEGKKTLDKSAFITKVLAQDSKLSKLKHPTLGPVGDSLAHPIIRERLALARLGK